MNFGFFIISKPKRAKRQLVETRDGVELHCNDDSKFEESADPIIELVPLYNEKKKSKTKKIKIPTSDSVLESNKDDISEITTSTCNSNKDDDSFLNDSNSLQHVSIDNNQSGNIL